MMAMKGRPIYASEVPSLVKEKSGGEYTISLACILAEFNRMAKEGLVEVDRPETRKKYYRPSKLGNERLVEYLRFQTNIPNTLPSDLSKEDIKDYFSVKGLVLNLLQKRASFCGADIIHALSLPEEGVNAPIYNRRGIYKAIGILCADGYIAVVDSNPDDKTRVYYQLTREGLLLAEDCNTFERLLMYHS